MPSISAPNNLSADSFYLSNVRNIYYVNSSKSIALQSLFAFVRRYFALKHISCAHKMASKVASSSGGQKSRDETGHRGNPEESQADYEYTGRTRNKGRADKPCKYLYIQPEVCYQ